MGSNRPEAIPEPEPGLVLILSIWVVVLILLSLWWVGFVTVVGWLWGAGDG